MNTDYHKNKTRGELCSWKKNKYFEDQQHKKKKESTELENVAWT